MDEVVEEFLVESTEMLDQMEQEMVSFEAGRAGPEAIRTIFRAIHTIKGTCGFLGMQRLQSLTHAAENLLSALRDGELGVTPAITSELLAVVDAVRRTLATIKETGSEGEPDFAPTIAQLQALLSSQQAPPAPSAPAIAGASAPVDAPAVAPAASATVPAASFVPPVQAAPAFAVHAAPVSASQAVPGPAQPAPLADPGSTEAAANGTIRVGVAVLDRLMTLVGELVLARNQVLRQAASLEDRQLSATSQRLNSITSELQEGVMKARMQPIGNLLGKLPRVVRDLAQETGKRARVEVVGAETELDKTILEAIKDPITHLVRNAVDHGLEPAADRIAKGKEPEGLLLVRAFHEGGQVNIEIADDGRGIDLERVKKKGLERALLDADQAARASDEEIFALMFQPGFSTAEKITSVSGRGVGLDVVKTNVERIGGSVAVSSRPGRGCTFRVRIPLTLAIVPALIVRCSEARYAIPQGSVLEVVRLDEKSSAGLEFVHGSPVYRLRGKLLPLVGLQRVLSRTPAPRLAFDGVVNIVVVQSERRRFGLVVDGIEDTLEIVVKPLDPALKNIPVFAGATVMGDGRVALILDISGTAQRGRVLAEEASARAAGVAAVDRERFLLVQGNGGSTLALPLSQVARLEEIDRDAVESSGSMEVVQYRGRIMPLVRVAEVLPERRSPERLARERKAGGAEPLVPGNGPLQVVVHRAGESDYGIVVERILDVVECAVEARRAPSRSGVLYSAVLANRITEMLDVQALIASVGNGAARAAMGS